MSRSVGASTEAARASSATIGPRAIPGVAEARKKPSHKSNIKPEFQYELLLMFAKNELSAAITAPLLAVIVAIGAMFWAPPRDLLLWLGAVLVAKAVQIAICIHFIKAPRDEATTSPWRARINAAELLYGVTRASVAFLSPHTAREAAHTFLFAPFPLLT